MDTAIVDTVYSPLLTIHTLAVNADTWKLQNVVSAHCRATGYQDDCYLAGRMLMTLVIDWNTTHTDTTIDISPDDARVIADATAWADRLIAEYRTQNAAEIADYERWEGKTLTDMDCFAYATA